MVLDPAGATTPAGDQTAAERLRHDLCMPHHIIHDGCQGHSSKAKKQAVAFLLVDLLIASSCERGGERGGGERGRGTQTDTVST